MYTIADGEQAMVSQEGTRPSTLGHTPHRKASSNSHRILYRGLLSLPDSHLPLDGLSFITNISETRLGTSSSSNLLENTLALALESMRGRPLHFKGTEKVRDVWLDNSAEINVYVHHYSTITQIYFENLFCLAEIDSPDRRTSFGIRVGLSDTSATDDFLIYGELRPLSPSAQESLPSGSSKLPETLCILAARILSHPPARVPRPDDPTPRKASAYLTDSTKRKRDLAGISLDLGEISKRSRANSHNAKGKGRADDMEDEQVRLAREVMLHMPKPSVSLPGVLGRDARPGKSAGGFKVPALPSRSQSQSLGKDDALHDADVSGTLESHSFRGKDRDRPGSDELEKANKTVIKQAAMTCLSKHGLRKGHSEFTEVFSATYRGTAFALRNIIRLQAVNMRIVDKLLEAHARVYVNGNGENHAATNDK